MIISTLVQQMNIKDLFKFLFSFSFLTFFFLVIFGYIQKGETSNNKNSLYRFEKYLQISENLKYLKEKYSLNEVNLYHLKKEENNIPLIISSESIKMNYEKYQMENFEPFLKEDQEKKSINCFKFKNKIREHDSVTICILVNDMKDLFFVEFLGENKKLDEIFFSKFIVEEIYAHLKEIKKFFITNSITSQK